MGRLSKHQRQILDLAKLDIDAVGYDISKIKVDFDWDEEHLETDEQGCEEIGLADNDGVVLSPELIGTDLYRTFLHEVAHVFGAGHRNLPGHLMSAVEEQRRERTVPTKAQRKRWMGQFVSAVRRAQKGKQARWRKEL